MAEPADSVFTETIVETPNEELPKTSIEDWVGEGKKFESAEELAKSYGHAQSLIQNMEKTQAELREDIDKQATIEQMFATLSAPQATQATPDGSEGEPVHSTVDLATSANELVDNKLESFRQDLAKEENRKEANRILLTRFGDQAQSEVQKVAKSVGYNMEKMQELAGDNLALFLQMFPRDAQPTSTQVQMTSSMNAETDLSGKQILRNSAYYKKLRQENPSGYYSPKIQSQMQKDAQINGDNHYK